MSGYYIVYPKNYPQIGVAVVWPTKPKRQPYISHIEGPFKTDKEVIIWMNKKDIPNMLRPAGYRGMYNWISEGVV